MRKTKAVIALFLASTLLAACNTVEGAGRDVKSVGDTVEDAAN